MQDPAHAEQAYPQVVHTAMTLGPAGQAARTHTPGLEADTQPHTLEGDTAGGGISPGHRLTRESVLAPCPSAPSP